MANSFFEQLLLEIKGISIQFASNRKKMQHVEETELYKQIHILENLTLSIFI